MEYISTLSVNMYINEAVILNRSVRSSTADGYKMLIESFLIAEKGGKDDARKLVEKAIPILQSGNNKSYLGKAYYELSNYYDYGDPQQITNPVRSYHPHKLAG